MSEPTMFRTVIHGDDHGVATEQSAFFLWRVPPNVGDFVELDAGTYVVERRVWTKILDLEIHLRRAEP